MSRPVAYPPAPWDLSGSGALTGWRVDAGAVPALPPGVHAATLRGRASVVTAFVDYTGGPLSYRELLAAVVVRRGRGVALSITHIWVDSEASLAGGRELWGIPKQLADFRGMTAVDERGPIAFATFLPPRRMPSPRLPLPPVPTTVVQTRGDAVVATPVRLSGRVRPAGADWTFPSANQLGWLRGASRVVDLAVPSFSLRFG